jgi:hypothetical protein
MLTVAGFTQCDGVDEELDLLVRAVKWCVKHERDREPGPKGGDGQIQVSAAELAAGLAQGPGDPDPIAMRRLRAILMLEGVASGGGGPSAEDPDAWHINLDRRVRRFAAVRTLSDLVQAVQRSPSLPAGVTSLDAVPTGNGEADSVRFVFVLMPFEKAWSEDVYAAMRRACARVDGSGRLGCQRADEMTRTGSITEQIVEAIRQADVLIADVTGSNPNVMYELGYADALGKPVVLLNQDVGASPFDIKVVRQIDYTSGGLEALEARLEAFLRTCLEVPEPGADASQLTVAAIGADIVPPRAPSLLRPSMRHSVGPFNMPQYRGLNCWLINDGPATVKVDRAALHHRGVVLGGHFRSSDGDELDARLVAAQEEMWVEFAPSAELAAVRADRDSELELDVRYHDPLDPQHWWITVVVRRGLDDGSTAKWTAIDQRGPRREVEVEPPAR